MLASLMYKFVLRFAAVKFKEILSNSSTGIVVDNNTLVHFCYPTEHISRDFFFRPYNTSCIGSLMPCQSWVFAWLTHWQKKFVFQKYEEKDSLMLVPPKYMVPVVHIIKVSSIRIHWINKQH